MITIDELRKLVIKLPARSGVGGIKAKTADRVYRFYNEQLIERRTDDVHTHTFGFHSTVEKGVLRNILYDVIVTDEESEYKLVQGKCQKGLQPPTVAENVIVKETFRTDMPTGTEYQIAQDAFHRVEFVTDSVVTSIVPTFIPTGDPKYAIEKSAEYVCPWGENKVSPAQCWEIIDTILAN